MCDTLCATPYHFNAAHNLQSKYYEKLIKISLDSLLFACLNPESINCINS